MNVKYNYITYSRDPYDRLISAFFYKNREKTWQRSARPHRARKHPDRESRGEPCRRAGSARSEFRNSESPRNRHRKEAGREFPASRQIPARPSDHHTRWQTAGLPLLQISAMRRATPRAASNKVVTIRPSGKKAPPSGDCPEHLRDGPHDHMHQANGNRGRFHRSRDRPYARPVWTNAPDAPKGPGRQIPDDLFRQPRPRD